MTRPRRPRSQPATAPSAPSAPSAPPDTFRFETALIFAIALGVRLLHVWLMHGSPYFDALMGDARGYDTWAQEIAHGDWIGRDVFYQAPLYPYFLGVLYTVFGHDLTMVRVCQAVLGALSSVALGVAGWRLFSARVGLVAGLVLALYATAIFFDGLIQKSSLDGFFTCVALALIGRIVAGPSARWPWLALGATMGAMALTRENALLLIGVIAVWALVVARAANRARGSSITPLAIFAVGLALVLAPVAMRNYAVGGGFYLTTSQFGPNFFIGNNPSADGTYMSLRFGRGAPEFERRDATELAEQARGRRLSPADVSSYWTDRGLAFITADPGRWLRLMLRKAALLVNASEMLDTESQESHAEWSWPLKVLSWIGHFGVLVPLAVAGMILSWPRRSTLWILYALTLAYAASVVLFFVFARYRYPLVPLLVLFASVAIRYAISAPLKAVPSHRQVPATHEEVPYKTQVPYGVMAAALVAAVVANWPMLSSSTMKAITETNVGLALQEGGASDRAIEHYRRAVQLDPGYVAAYSNLGTALRAQGKPAEAVAAYEQALARLPETADILINFGNAKISTGDLPGAVDAFRRAVGADPASQDARNSLARATYDLGSALLERSAYADAERALREAIAIDGTMADAHNNLGIALASQGRISEAIVEFRRALEIRPGFADAEQNLAMAMQAQRR